MENIWHKNAKNAYFARYRLNSLYNNETYQLQLDSHHRFKKDWDTKMIKMLHSCDAGEKSVLTVYGSGFVHKDLKDPDSKIMLNIEPILAMRLYEYRRDG